MAEVSRRDTQRFATVEEAIEDYRQGKLVIIVDDEDRENEGDLCMAAEFVTPEAITFMAREACGLICVPMLQSRLEDLRLPMMVRENTSGFGTAFTVTVDAERHFGVTTGISAADRATTIKVLIDPNTKPSDLSRPGLKMLTVAHLIEYRRRTEHLITKLAEAPIPTEFGEFALHVYESTVDG